MAANPSAMMRHIDKHLMLSLGAREMRFLFLLLASTLALSCTLQRQYEAEQFVGTWKSSRMASRPLHLLANGEWEIRAMSAGKPLEYGVWHVQSDSITWTRRRENQALYDRNVIVSVAPARFVLREQDGSLTTFEKVE